MTVTYAKKPRRCDACGQMIYTGQLVSTLSGVAHVDCEHPNAHREGRPVAAPVVAAADEAPITEPIGDTGRVRVRYGGHVAEGVLSPSGPDSFQFSGLMVCGPHDADGVHLVAADQEESTVQTSSGPGDGQPIRSTSTGDES